MSMLEADADKEVEDDTQLVQILMEAHMILPGLLSIIGLQIVSVFNNVFQEQLQPHERALHLTALALLGIGVGLVLTPAAYHRQVAPQTIPKDFQRLASHFITAAMVPLMLALTIDFYLVVQLALDQGGVCIALAVGMLVLFGGLWFVFPQVVCRQRARNSKHGREREGAVRGEAEAAR